MVLEKNNVALLIPQIKQTITFTLSPPDRKRRIIVPRIVRIPPIKWDAVLNRSVGTFVKWKILGGIELSSVLGLSKFAVSGILLKHHRERSNSMFRSHGKLM